MDPEQFTLPSSHVVERGAGAALAAVRTGLFEARGRCHSCGASSREHFELPTSSEVGERNPATWPCRCGVEVQGSAQCLAVWMPQD